VVSSICVRAASPAFNRGRLSGTFNDRRVVLVENDLLRRLAQIFNLVLQLDTKIFGDCLAAGQDAMSSSIARRSPKPEPSRCSLQRAAQLVHHKRGERFHFFP
jgi:hypothetical protein